MPSHLLRARKPTGDVRRLRLIDDPDLIRPHLEDAAHFPGGRADALADASNEAEVAAAMKSARTILPIGAQSSLTGGGSPAGGVVLTTRRMKGVEMLEQGGVRAGAGVTMAELDEALAARGAYYPPSPTFMGASVSGTIATNAAGAATFKYGATRNWVQAITVVLPDGDVLDIERGETQAHPDGYFELDLARGRVRIDLPRYRMPRVPKVSAGYYAAPGMDLIDLFIGSEGTLGVITEATLRVVEPRPSSCLVFIPFDEPPRAIRFVRALREASRRTWATRDLHGIDASAVEHMDARGLELVREDGAGRANGVSIPESARLALLVTLELGAGTTAEQVYADIAGAGERVASDSPIARFLQMLADACGASLEDSSWLEHVHIAVPADHQRARQLLAVREAVPSAVNSRIARAQRSVDPRIEKTAADMAVPFDRVEEMLAFYTREFEERGLDAAIWGHLSDGNVHPNILPRSFADVESGRDAIMAFGRETIRLGGSPLAEHGVGRSRTKQRLLREMYGDEGIEQMKRVKRALDPEWKLAPGVIFEST